MNTDREKEHVSYLDQICGPNDIRKIPEEALPELAEEIRAFLIRSVSETGGHLASNLGVVELTMALHLVLDFPKDKLIWDVGHQSYVHKILTGRKDRFPTLRQAGGLSGFPKMRESSCDAFDTGHSSTSIAAALGYAQARDLRGTDENVVCVIGDGALSGGMAYEALNNAAQMKKSFIVVLNDNNMSISENVGGMAAYLGKLRAGDQYRNLKDGVEQALMGIPAIGEALTKTVRRSKEHLKSLVLPSMIFEDMGLTYIGPIDGHNIGQMVTAFQAAKRLDEPVLVHVVTKKGKGYRFAEEHPDRFHGISPFYVATGRLKNPSSGVSWTHIFGEEMLRLGLEKPELVAVTAAMPEGTGLAKFGRTFPNRVFDVGIAEEHAVTFAAGMAAGGLIPGAAIYSTFLQRAYDQILEDICMNSLPVILAVDRGGIVGRDGETHQGIYDLSYLTSMPNLCVLAPKNGPELAAMLDWAVDSGRPAAIRYPRGEAFMGLSEYKARICAGRAEVIHEAEAGKVRVLLLAVGCMVETADAVRTLLEEEGIASTLVNMRFVKPMDTELLKKLIPAHDYIVTMEENVRPGGFGEHVAAWMETEEQNRPLLIAALPDAPLPQGSQAELRAMDGMDAESLTVKIKELIRTNRREQI